MSDLVGKLNALKTDVTRAEQLYAQAEGTLAAARQQLLAVDDELKKLGIDPANADVQLAALETDLAVKVEVLTQKVAERVTEYERVLALAKQVFAA